ncbi:MAG: hypothetical protein DRQ41_15270, partial [Gammaproteobacteria bacterium]
MPRLTHNPNNKVFYWIGSFDDRNKAKDAGFRYITDPKQKGVWFTKDKFKALSLIDYADQPVIDELINLEAVISESALKWSYRTT